MEKDTILIVDDNDTNRELLSEMLGDEYGILEAANGKEALAVLEKESARVSLILLDMIMPEMNGLELLEVLKNNGTLIDIPVIMISTDDNADIIHKAYETGVTDYIRRPFDCTIVRKRCDNVISLYSKQKKLVGLFADQFYEREKNSRLLIDILAHIVEFRNNESATHVINVQSYSEILLKELVKITDKYGLDEKDIQLIANVAALHDIGKISIPDEVLNKPGRLTDEEFKIMKSHSAVGSQMLADLPFHREEPLVKLAYAITRWHHERWDGRGYPDGLVGDDIPIGAQVVSLADVYDALTAERCYKKAFSHETAIEMILNGECGKFNPLLLDCLRNRAEEMRLVKEGGGSGVKTEDEIKSFARELLKSDALYSSDRLLHMLEYEKMKNRFFEGITGGCSFDYNATTKILTLSKKAADVLGINESIFDPVHDASLISLFGKETLSEIASKLRAGSSQSPITQLFLHQVVMPDSTGKLTQSFRLSFTAEDAGNYPTNVKCNTYRLICRSAWTLEAPERYTGAIGKLVPRETDYGIMKGVDILDIDSIL